MELEPYLFLGGRCEEALNFYAKVFGGEITSLNRFEDAPGEMGVDPAHKQKVMHANFVAPSLKFMAADGRPGSPQTSGNITLSLATSDLDEGERVFSALAEGGTVDTPLTDMFWGARFGLLTDKFGIDWMINCMKE
jgi:PhnB protein